MATALKTRPQVRSAAAKPKRSAAPVKSVPKARAVAEASITLSSKNYSSWSLRGWLIAKLAGLDFDEVMVSTDDANARKEILLLSPSILVPCLSHGGIKVWDTLAIGEYLDEVKPKAGLLPTDIAARAHCRAICGEMHSGFSSLRAALPMNLRAHFPKYKIWARAQGDIDRITQIWRECLENYGGPYLFGAQRCLADAMYAPVCTRLKTYDVKVDPLSAGYCKTILAMPEMLEWTAAALQEPEEIDELDMEF